MIKLIVPFLLISMLSSCANMSKKGKKINDLDDDFSWIDNEDFQKEFEVKYQEPKDHYPREIANEDALSTESVARLDEGKIESVMEKDDVISNVVGNCYKKEFNNAAEIVRKNKDKYKLNPSFWNQVGTCYYLQNEKRKALIFYNKALSIKKDFAPAINNLGVIHQSDGNDQRALAAFEEASRVSSFSLTPTFNKGQLYLKYGFVDKAEDTFSSLWRKNKRDKDVIHALAVVYLMKGQFDKSIGAFQALEYDLQEKAEVALNYALALGFANQKEKAAKVLKNINDRDIARFPIYYNRVKAVIGAKYD